MPASTTDLIDAALFSAFSRKSSNEVNGSDAIIQNQHFPTAKQALLNNIKTINPIKKQSLALGSGASIHALQKKYGMLKGDKKLSSNNSSKNTMAHSKNDDKLDEPRTILWPAENVVLGWRKTFPPGAGMINLGNTCYMNSSLQALFHIPSVVNWLLEEASTHIPSCEANVHSASYCSICGMMKTLKQALDRDNSVIKPSHIHNKLKCIGKTLLYGRQEDAHEFIKMLLDHMEKSFLSFVRANKLDHRSKETTPLNQIFGGYLRQQVICPLCHYVSTTFSHFQDIVLDIRSVGSVEEALNLYFRKETLDSDNAYKCEKCHKKVPATKRHLIEKAPHVLLLQLKRFTISGGKITKHVNIQKTIDLSKYVNGVRTAPSGGGTYCYKLASMVIHIGGSQHGGHYTAVAESSSKAMFEFDDSSVRPISMQSALLRNPYILFYEMVHKPKNIPSVKQVMRQSSEKALLRQSSTDRLSKPLPTSLSTSCMSNGIGTASSEVGETVSRSAYQQKNKSPLVSHKERDRVSFGIKSNSLSSKRDSVDKNSNSSSSSGYSSFQSSSSSVNKGSLKTNRTLSSLVPYNSDSDSEDEKKSSLTNGHHNTNESGHSKSQEIVKVPASKLVSSENGCVSKIRKSFCNEDRIAGSYTTVKSNGKQSSPYVQRTLQVNLSKTLSSKICGNGHMNGQSLSDTHEAKNPSIETKNGVTNKSKSHNSSKGEQVTSNNSNNNKDSASSYNKSKRPELEKSLSHDSVVPTTKSRTLDRVETASLDSNRSDKSLKSMKKSLFSLFPCVSSTQSPDLSPENERMNSIVEHSENVLSPIKNDLRSSQDLDNGTESQFSKRNRDNDDHEPSSPSKKCRPEDRLRLSENGSVKNGKVPIEDEKKNENCSKNGHCSPNSDGSFPDKNKIIKNGSLRDDENFSMEEKKSRHKKRKKHEEYSSSSEEEEDSECNTKRSSVNPNATVISWDQNIKDLFHKKNKEKGVDLPEFPKSSSDQGNSVLNELKKSGDYSFGVPVSTWDGAPSLLDTQTQKARKEALKRTADDLYNEELDAGRVSKKKLKYDMYDDDQPRENPFQKYQNNMSSSSKPSFSSNGKNWDDNNSSHHRNNFPKRRNNHRNHNSSWNSGDSSRSFYPSSNHYRSNSFGGNKPWHQKNRDSSYGGNRNRDNKFRYRRH